LKSIEST